MKKNIPFLLALTIILACSPRKDGFVNRKYQGFTTQYNVLFNGQEALKSELTNREKSYKDNFYAPYIKLLTYEEQASASTMDNLGFTPNTEEYRLPISLEMMRQTTALVIQEILLVLYKLQK